MIYNTKADNSELPASFFILWRRHHIDILRSSLNFFSAFLEDIQREQKMLWIGEIRWIFPVYYPFAPPKEGGVQIKQQSCLKWGVILKLSPARATWAYLLKWGKCIASKVGTGSYCQNVPTHTGDNTGI